MKTTEQHGFMEAGTGGGCTALIRTEPDGAEILITRAGDPTAPDFLTDPVTVSVSDAEGRTVFLADYGTLREAYAAIEKGLGR